MLPRGAVICPRGHRSAAARHPAPVARVAPRALLSDPRALLPLSAGAEPVRPTTAKRAAHVGAVRLLIGGGALLPDATAGDQAWGGLRARQRQPVALAALPLDAVRHPRPRRGCAGVPALLVDASAR